jgi:hypothetical protein
MISSTGFRFAPPGAKLFEPAPQAQGLSSYEFLATEDTEITEKLFQNSVLSVTSVAILTPG